jgi:uncharacterized repeat protein (TIGR01451 family)
VAGPGNGGAGNDPCGGAGPGGNGGLGGTAGGTGGASAGTFSGNPGGGGSLGQGGGGANCADSGGGAGGGGGYYGGGGGCGLGSGGGGGAGSSFWVTGGTGTSMNNDTTGTPEVQITPVITAPDLSLTDTAPASVISGNSYSYTLMATNTGGSDATSVVLADTLPASVHFNSASATQGSCPRTPSTGPKTKGGTVSCTVGSLAAGASVTVTINVTATRPGTVSDAATVTASNVTADPDDSAAARTTVTGS